MITYYRREVQRTVRTMGETVCVHFPDELLDEMESRIEASFDHEDRSQFVRASVRRMLAEPGEVDYTAGRKL